MTLWRKFLGMSIAARSAFTVASAVLLIVVALGAGYFMIARTSSSVAEVRAATVVAQVDQHNLCIAINQENAKQILLWQYLLRLSPPKTPQQRQLDQQFEAFLNQVFKPVRCP